MLRKSVLSACVGGALVASGWCSSNFAPWADSVARAADAPREYQTSEAIPVNLLAPLPPDLESLKIKVRRALALYHAPRLNTRDHNSWEVMHAIIAYGINSELRNHGPMGPVLNSIGCLCYNYPCKSQQLFYVENGRVQASKGVGVQGHPGQFLAIVAQSHLAATYPMLVEGKQFTIADLIESEKLDCQTGMELTFKLISLSHYLEPDATWKNSAGEEWSISRLIHEEIKSPINGVACGGTHRLMGMSYAVRKRVQHNQPINGEFRRAKIYTEDFHRYTLGMQNPDGSFSTEWFVGPGNRSDIDRRLQTTGHIMEWLAFSMPEEELKSRAMTRAASYLAGILLAAPDHDWSIGPFGHALHALAIYDERLFKAHEQAATAPLAVDENPAHSAPKKAEVKPVPKTVAKKPAPAVVAERPAPEVLELEKAPADLLDMQPKPQALAERPAPQIKPEGPAVVPAEIPLLPLVKSEAADAESGPASLGAPALLGAVPPVTTSVPPAAVDVPVEQPTLAPVVEETSAPKLRHSPLAPRRAPAWRR
jgi:hypothetical protein